MQARRAAPRCLDAPQQHRGDRRRRAGVLVRHGFQDDDEAGEPVGGRDEAANARLRARDDLELVVERPERDDAEVRHAADEHRGRGEAAGQVEVEQHGVRRCPQDSLRQLSDAGDGLRQRDPRPRAQRFREALAQQRESRSDDHGHRRGARRRRAGVPQPARHRDAGSVRRFSMRAHPDPFHSTSRPRPDPAAPALRAHRERDPELSPPTGCGRARGSRGGSPGGPRRRARGRRGSSPCA